MIRINSDGTVDDARSVLRHNDCNGLIVDDGILIFCSKCKKGIKLKEIEKTTYKDWVEEYV